jgi:hypothetical protein
MPLLKTVVHDLGLRPALTGLCAGYERSEWRAEALAQRMLEHLPDFCLTWSEYTALSHATAVHLLRTAASRVFTTSKFRNRGEFGELLLHMVLKETMASIPAISKIYYKDASNDTVKGFDAVHVVAIDGQLQLWLGEVKFYADINDAIQKVVQELQDHTESNYLRGEFCAITNKIDPAWPHAEKLKLLLSPSVSLDEIFDAACIPVLLTYDGDVTAAHSEHCATYFEDLQVELLAIYSKFASQRLPTDISIHLFLIPLKTKEILITHLDQKLKAWQSI